MHQCVHICTIDVAQAVTSAFALLRAHLSPLSCNTADFPARVTAHTVQVGAETRTTILIKFAQEVMEREKRMG